MAFRKLAPSDWMCTRKLRLFGLRLEDRQHPFQSSDMSGTGQGIGMRPHQLRIGGCGPVCI
ncbi:MAG TPA: hypothetical protein VEV37_01915 [Bryobacteraceae bacterium]|nr:hypothetical protein [Bryobacteraceae bacterium]